MDDHPPCWETNGVDILSKFGVQSFNATRLNLFLPNATDSMPKEMDTVALAAGLVDNYSLSSLELHRCAITTDSMNALAQAISVNKYITYLGLSRNKFYTRGGIALAEALKINQTINTIDLGWNELRDDFAGALAEVFAMNNSIQRVCLDRNKLSADGVSALAHALQQNQKVRYLGLSGNSLTGAACSFIGQMLAVNETLATLDISLNGISNEGIISLFNAIGALACCHLTTLNVGGNRVGPGIVAVGLALPTLSMLRELNLSFTYLEPGAPLEQFSKALVANKTICNLSFACNPKLGDTGIKTLCEALAELRSLRYLDLTDTSMTVSSLPHLHALLRRSSLTTLHLSQNNLSGASQTGKELRDAVLACQSLGFLGLFRCKLSDTQLMNFLVGPLHLTGLTIRENGASPVTVVKAVQACMYGKLNYLDVSMNRGDSSVYQYLPDLFETNPSLPYVVLADNTIIDRTRVRHRWEEVNNRSPALPEHAAPPLCRANWDIQRSFPPSAGFASYSVTQGSAMVRHHDCSDVLLSGLLNWAGVPVKHCHVFDGNKMGPTPSLRMRNGTLLDSALHPASISAYENNIGGLLVSDDQLRREFNRLDVNGDGYLSRAEFRKVYSSFEHFGLGHLSREDLDRVLSRFASDGKISFDEFCVVMLKLVQH